VRDQTFRALVQRIDGSPWHPLETIAVYEDGAVTFAAIVEAVDAAHEEVLLETYILRDDRIGTAMREALGAAARRGVRVHVLADAFGSLGTREDYWRAMADAGVHVRRFPRSWRHPLRNLQRDHRKIVVVDRAVAFTGGMNIGEEYGSAVTAAGRPWRDTFIRVEGAVARELAAVFAEGWNRAGGGRLPGLEAVTWEAGLPPAMDDTTTAGPSVLVLDLRPGRAQRETEAVYTALADASRLRLWITTPYFAPPDRGLARLEAAAARGVDVRLLLPGRSDVPVLRHAAHGAYARLLRAGVRIWEYDATVVLHAKTLVVDGYASIVGSSNLDFRSFWLNAECNLLLFDDANGGVARSLRWAL
jgi:cardiolipin synthase